MVDDLTLPAAPLSPVWWKPGDRAWLHDYPSLVTQVIMGTVCGYPDNGTVHSFQRVIDGVVQPERVERATRGHVSRFYRSEAEARAAVVKDHERDQGEQLTLLRFRHERALLLKAMRMGMGNLDAADHAAVTRIMATPTPELSTP